MLLPNDLSHLFRALGLPLYLGRLLLAQIGLLPGVQRRFADIQLPRYLPVGLTAVEQKLHRFAFELLPISSSHFTVLHGSTHFTLCSRVRKIRGGSDFPLLLPENLLGKLLINDCSR